VAREGEEVIRMATCTIRNSMLNWTVFVLATTAACVEPPTEGAEPEADGLETRLYAPPAYPDTVLQDHFGQPSPGPSPYFKHGVVAASDPLAAAVGREVLANGGDAIDAAVAVQAALAVVEPQASGLGGGAIWLIHRADANASVVVDCRERAPGAATPDMFAGQPSYDIKSTSGLSVGVPGTLHCMRAALSLRPGKHELGELLQPAIDLAAKGFLVGPRLADDTAQPRLKFELGVPAYDEARKVFRPGGLGLSQGDKLKQTDLAQTLKLVQLHGLPAFYDCDHPAGIAKSIVETQKATRSQWPEGAGRMTCDDLAQFKATIEEPLVGDYRGYKIVTTPPPTSGLSLLQMLGVLEHFDFSEPEYGFGEFLSMNVMMETMRMAFADRGLWLGDPEQVWVPTKGLLSPYYLGMRARTIVPGKRQEDIDPGDPRLWDVLPISNSPNMETPIWEQEGKDTTHYVVSDAKGNVVSVTTTIAEKWGTGLMVKDRGFFLNDQMQNFNDTPLYSQVPFDPGANDIAPYKRSRTALTPTLVLLNDQVIAALGSPGGGALLNGVVEFIVNLVDHRMTLQEAVAAPRFSLDNSHAVTDTEIEPGFSAETRVSLAELGYDFVTVQDIGAVQAVIINQPDGRQYGTADPRRQGVVEGLQ
jgi:gamma-glutamyltranspeptidase/glutathione hydrolase